MEPSSRIKVAVAGAAGRMGVEVLKTVVAAPDMELVAAADHHHVGGSIRILAGPDAPDFPIDGSLGHAIEKGRPEVYVDFTNGESAASNALTAIMHGVSPVIGASGLDPKAIDEISAAATAYNVPACLIPNFAVGAVLMTRFAEMAAEWMPHVEVIEMHHDRKLDAPSGTAIHTAQRIAAARGDAPPKKVEEFEKYDGARGSVVEGVSVHSVRLPGLVAHQMVLFGGEGELLTIRHDSLARTSFMEGVKLAIRKVRSQSGLVIGLDKLMF
jgi:4-hydroxy-tetrahydrodipicolinate reductase